jgi:hypothetical protein
VPAIGNAHTHIGNQSHKSGVTASTNPQCHYHDPEGQTDLIVPKQLGQEVIHVLRARHAPDLETFTNPVILDPFQH